ncbi:hypothetical protein [Comamonas sp. JC664]|uniref:hypothetical protein n=1 Tax=Comamonas sp. JC664 TaxID=2801917 RepID=UPI003619742F
MTSINFQLNLGFLLTFMLTARAGVGGYRLPQSAGLQLELHAPEAQFAGQPLRLDLRLDNPSRRARYALGTRHYQGHELSRWTPRPSHTPMQLSTQAQQRGYQSLPAVSGRDPLSTRRLSHVDRL